MRLVLTGGKIYIRRGVFAQAVLVENDRILLTGDCAQVLAAAGTDAEVIDLRGRTVIPGFNDCHQHVLMTGMGMTRPNTVGVRSIDELVDRVRAFIRENPQYAEKGVLSMGWNQDLFTADRRIPDRYDLDRISTEIPVVLSRVCGHVASANSRAIQLLRQRGDMRPEAGGAIEVDVNGEPTGIFTETAVELAQSVVPPLTVEENKRAFLLAAEYALAHGITSVQANDVGNATLPMAEVFAMLHDIYDHGETPLRYHAQVCFHTVEEFETYALGGEYARQKALSGDYLTVGPLKLFKDGSLGGRTATMRAGYLDDPGNFGVESTSDEDMERFCRIADRAGMQVVTHVIGDKAIEDVVSNYEHVLRGGKNPLRHALLHCQITDRPLLERIARDDILVMYQPVFLDYDMHAVISRCGEALSGTSYAFRTMEALGGHVSYGTDSPVEDCDPFANVYHAVTRRDKVGWPESGFFPEERVDVAQAIDAYTIGSAYNQFQEAVKGRIQPGYLADLVVLDRDIFTCDPMEIANIRPVMTIVGGQVVYRRKMDD